MQEGPLTVPGGAVAVSLIRSPPLRLREVLTLATALHSPSWCPRNWELWSVLVKCALLGPQGQHVSAVATCCELWDRGRDKAAVPCVSRTPASRGKCSRPRSPWEVVGVATRRQARLAQVDSCISGPWENWWLSGLARLTGKLRTLGTQGVRPRSDVVFLTS